MTVVYLAPPFSAAAFRLAISSSVKNWAILSSGILEKFLLRDDVRKASESGDQMLLIHSQELSEMS